MSNQTAGRLVAVLTWNFGVRHLDLVEDVVQEELLKALRIWPTMGTPENPSAWLLTAAKNRALDIFRRDTRWNRKTHSRIL